MPEATAPGAPRPVTPLGIAAGLLAGVLADHDLEPAARVDVDRARRLVGDLDGYVASVTTPASPGLVALERRTAAEDWRTRAAPGVPHLEQEMLSGHVEGAFLRFLVGATRAERVLEIGMFTGYSALAMAEALPAHGVLVACELDPGVAGLAQECFAGLEAGERIRVEVGPAAATLSRLAAAGEQFDLVFIDADKTGYDGYLDAVLGLDGDPATGLLAPGGTICLDNTLLQGEPWVGPPGTPTDNGRAIAALNARLAHDPRVEQVLVPLRDGLTLVRRLGS